MKPVRILHIIEGITFPDFLLSDKDKLNMIYKYAHIGVGNCKNKHEDWVKDAETTEKALKKFGII